MSKIEKKCKHVYYDEAGHYCKLIPMVLDKDYPHKYWRVFCHGNVDSLHCTNMAKIKEEIRR